MKNKSSQHRNINYVNKFLLYVSILIHKIEYKIAFILKHKIQL